MYCGGFLVSVIKGKLCPEPLVWNKHSSWDVFATRTLISLIGFVSRSQQHSATVELHFSVKSIFDTIQAVISLIIVVWIKMVEHNRVLEAVLCDRLSPTAGREMLSFSLKLSDMHKKIYCCFLFYYCTVKRDTLDEYDAETSYRKWPTQQCFFFFLPSCQWRLDSF